MADEAPKTEAPAAEAAPAAKSGFRTTEFWITAVVTVAGLVAASGIFPTDSPWVKVAGLIVSAGAALGYTASRTMVKNAAKVLLVAFTLSLAVGCSQKGYVRADAIDGSVNTICERHDKMLRGELDPKSIKDDDKKTYLRTSELLRKTVAEAKKE